MKGGAYSSVKSAINTFTGEEVAVKITKTTNQTREMLRNEFEILQKLFYPCIIKPIAFETDLYNSYLFMPHLGDTSLSDIRLNSETELWPIAQQVLEILSYLQSKGYIHRDVKPGNFMLRYGQVTLIDFQTCIAYDPRKRMESEVGTEGFQAPEMKDWKYYGYLTPRYKVDVWSAGATFAYLLGLKPKHFMRRPCSLFQDFMQSILDEQPEQRISALEARNHRWLVDRPQPGASMQGREDCTVDMQTD